MGKPNQYLKHQVDVRATAREALKLIEQLPDNGIRTLFVLDGKKLVGTLTDGDIRRGLLVDREISESVSLYMNRNFRHLKKGNITPELLSDYRALEIWLLPVLSEDGEIDEIINLKFTRTVIPAAALITAGGKGERLRPLTDSMPKPMLPIGSKPLLELNIDRMIQFGIKKFYISVKYLSEKIIGHFGDGSSKNVSIQYLHEEEPLGTLGACSLINELDYEQLIVMNGDLLTNIDFEDFYKFYLSSRALMCVATVPYNVSIPYGIMKTDETDRVTDLEEKPTYTFYANAGIYLLNNELIKRIPKSAFYNATDLMQQMIDRSERLVQYPIVQYWLDIGKYEDYIRAQEDFKHISF
jgi:dTDP-glucose pyrophosphorylase